MGKSTRDAEGDTVDVHGGGLNPGTSLNETARPMPSPVVSLGTIVGGRYRLIELLGEGGMGQVFVAENMSIGLRVAIKVVKPRLLADAVFQTRFIREAKAIAAIQHPNVVRFLDLILGEPAFLVMELVRGPTLHDHLRRVERVAPHRAVQIAERLARALSAVHAAGVIHRDLKPSNIILLEDELGTTPKIIDFGVVRFIEASEGLQVTQSGHVVGTVHFMAPEQVSTGEVDARADLYALGSVLYCMLAGHPPFAGSSDESNLLVRLLQEEPPPLNAELPPDLRRLVASLLAKRPEARPASATEVALALKRIRRALEAAESARTPVSPWRRVKAAAAIVVPTLAAATVAFVAGRYLSPRAPTTLPPGLIAIGSDPPGARVTLDGHTLPETTPTAVHGIGGGRHRIRIEAEHRSPMEQTVELADGDREIVNVKLPPATHSVDIQTKPGDATLFLNNRLILQRTPVRVDLDDDEFYELRIEKLGYEPLQTRLTPEQRGAVTFALEPEREARGSIVVESNVTARVLIDGGDSGFYTPTAAISLPVGAHRVQLRSSLGVDSPVYRFTLKAGQTLRLSLDPQSDKKPR